MADPLSTMLIKHEGLRYSPYKDSMGHWTVGVGHNLDANPLPAGTTYPLTMDQILSILQGDIQVAKNALVSNLDWFGTLDQVRQDILTDMCFNMGWVTLGTFHKFLGLVQSGNYASASQDMLTTKWAKEVGSRATDLSAMMLSGAYPTVASLTKSTWWQPWTWLSAFRSWLSRILGS